MVQHRISEFVPMQETGDSIWEMLKRIGKLNTMDPECNEYKTLLNRVRTQSFCMQGISQDTTMKNTSQYRNFITTVENMLKQREIHPLVLHCINNILPILKGDQRVQDSLKYNGNVGHGSGSIVSAFFKSQNHIDERERFAQTNPEEYARQCKFNIHGKEQGPNYRELYYNNEHRSHHEQNYLQNRNSDFEYSSKEKFDKYNKGLNSNHYPESKDHNYKDKSPPYSSNYNRDSHMNKNQHHSGPKDTYSHSNGTSNTRSSHPKDMQASDYQNRDSQSKKGHQSELEESDIHSDHISDTQNHGSNSYNNDPKNINPQGTESVSKDDQQPLVTENINHNPASSRSVNNYNQTPAKSGKGFSGEKSSDARKSNDTRGKSSNYGSGYSKKK